MNLIQYVNELRDQLAVAAEAGGPEAVALAERLTAPLEAAARLVLLEALSAAANEITRELSPGSVDLRLRGRDPEFVVTLPPARDFPEVENRSESVASPAGQAAPGEGDEGGTSRITLRLSDQLKLRMEEAAGREGLSVNAWLVRAVAAAVEPRPRSSVQTNAGYGARYTGWVR